MSQKKNAVKHGMSRHPVYRSWTGMRGRCQNPANKDYAGRGIAVCERWQKFENFRDDMLASWSLGTTIERVNNDGNYELSNCRWATPKEQANNRRMSVTKEVLQQLKDNSLTLAHYRSRMFCGWTEEQARSIALGVKR